MDKIRTIFIIVVFFILAFLSCGCLSSEPTVTSHNSPTDLSRSPTVKQIPLISVPVTLLTTGSPEFESYQRGVSLYNVGKYKEAIEVFNATISLNETDGESYFARGKAFYQIGKLKRYEFQGDEEFNQAISDFDEAIYRGLNFNSRMELLTLRGYCNFYLAENQRNRYTKIGERSFPYYEKAIIDFSRVLEDNPDNIDALVGRSMANSIVGDGCPEPEYQYNQNKRDLARVDGQRAIQLAPDNGWAQFAYCISQDECIREKAIAVLDEAIKDDPNEAIFYVQRAARKFFLQDYVGARSDYAKALELQPRFAMAYQGLGYVERREGYNEAALVNMQKALEINPNMAMWWGEFGFTQKSLLDPITVRGLEEVLQSYDRGIAIDPEDPNIHVDRWDVLMCLNRIPEAKEELRIYKSLQYSDPETEEFMEEVTDDPYYNPKFMARYRE